MNKMHQMIQQVKQQIRELEMSENFKLVPVDKLTGRTLDWAVAKCEGAVYPSKAAHWTDVKELATPFALWRIAFDMDGQCLAEKVEVSEVCAVYTRTPVVRADIVAVGPLSGSFVDDLSYYYLTQQDAENEIRRIAKGDLNSPKRYSTDWSLAGPIIEREAISVSALYAQKSSPIPEFSFGEWGAYIPVGCNGIGSMSANTPLEAAMRCFVASKFGDEVEVPRQLIEPWLTQPQRNFNMPENSKVVQTPGNYFFAGVPVYVPNEVRQSDPQFYISYNGSYNGSYRDYGCPTTALVVQSPETSFYILCGDHRKAYEGKNLDECLSYFRENPTLQHKYSDKLL